MTEAAESLKAIFEPESVAVIGASKQPGKVGHDIFVNILKGGYTGTLYPVNPRATSIASVKCYASVSDIPDPIDLAMIILPPLAAMKAVQDSIAKGVRGIVIVSAGFREVGPEGRAIEGKQLTWRRQDKKSSVSSVLSTNLFLFSFSKKKKKKKTKLSPCAARLM